MVLGWAGLGDLYHSSCALNGKERKISVTSTFLLDHGSMALPKRISLGFDRTHFHHRSQSRIPELASRVNYVKLFAFLMSFSMFGFTTTEMVVFWENQTLQSMLLRNTLFLFDRLTC